MKKDSAEHLWVKKYQLILQIYSSNGMVQNLKSIHILLNSTSSPACATQVLEQGTVDRALQWACHMPSTENYFSSTFHLHPNCLVCLAMPAGVFDCHVAWGRSCIVRLSSEMITNMFRGGNMCVSVVSGLHVTHPLMMFLKRNPLENLVAERSRRFFFNKPLGMQKQLQKNVTYNLLVLSSSCFDWCCIFVCSTLMGPFKQRNLASNIAVNQFERTWNYLLGCLVQSEWWNSYCWYCWVPTWYLRVLSIASCDCWNRCW